MNKLIFVIAAACTALACNKSDTDTTRTTSATTGVTATTADNADNTKLNERDRNGATPTSGDQGNSKADVALTSEIRKAINSDSALSVDAKNVKIVSRDGAVILRGPVKSEAEKTTVGSKASGVAGVKSVENQLDVVTDKRGNQ